MEIRCTCGAVPPADARFCHKCGRPLKEEDAVLLAEAQAAAAPTPVPPAVALAPEPGISFRNMRAVGISIGVAVSIFVSMGLIGVLLPPFGTLAAPLVLAAGGFFAVLMYARQTRRPLSGGSGARLGWMTGLWFFLGTLILMTIFVAVISGPMGPEVMRQMQANPQLANMKLPAPNEMASLVLKGAVQLFFVAILFPIFGGVVGARFTSRNHSRA